MKTHNLFISHSWSYSDEYERLVALLRKRKYFRFKDYSVPRDDPIHNAGTDFELREAIRKKMYPCSVVLIVARVSATYSKWIEKEIFLAKSGFRTPKPIIAIEPRSSQRTSGLAKVSANRVVRWSTESIVEAILDLG